MEAPLPPILFQPPQQRVDQHWHRSHDLPASGPSPALPQLPGADVHFNKIPHDLIRSSNAYEVREAMFQYVM